MTKPNCTITKQHDKQLDQLARSRYASRSEALRAAITTLAESLQEDGRHVQDQILVSLEQLVEKLENLDERLDKLEQTPPTYQNPASPSPPKSKVSQSGFKPVESVSSETDSDTASETDVYAALSKQSALSIPEIANKIDSEPLRVSDALDGLIDRGFVSETTHNGELQYFVQSKEEGQQ